MIGRGWGGGGEEEDIWLKKMEGEDGRVEEKREE